MILPLGHLDTQDTSTQLNRHTLMLDAFREVEGSREGAKATLRDPVPVLGIVTSKGTRCQLWFAFVTRLALGVAFRPGGGGVRCGILYQTRAVRSVDRAADDKGAVAREVDASTSRCR